MKKPILFILLLAAIASCKNDVRKDFTHTLTFGKEKYWDRYAYNDKGQIRNTYQGNTFNIDGWVTCFAVDTTKVWNDSFQYYSFWRLVNDSTIELSS